jgi:hypothetical protein
MSGDKLVAYVGKKLLDQPDIVTKTSMTLKG